MKDFNQSFKGLKMNDFNSHNLDASEDSSARFEAPQANHGVHGVRHPVELTDDLLNAIDTRLSKLPRRQKVTMEMAIKRLSPRIKKMRENGLSNAEIAEELTRELSIFGMAVSARTLARHVPGKSKRTTANSDIKTAN